MAALEDRLLDALSKAAVAEAIATKALSLAQDLYAEMKAMKLQAQPSMPYPIDPFLPSDHPEPPESIPPQVKLSPFTLGNKAKVIMKPQTLKEANTQLEKPLNEAELAQAQIWDEATT